MWAAGEDTNDDGAPVRLYQPILYSGRASNGADDPIFSHVGGMPSYFESDDAVDMDTPQCASCKQDMPLLLQLHIPGIAQQEKSRTLYVFGCNRGSCVGSLFETSKFSLGGCGIVVCRRSQPGCHGDSREKREATAQASATPTPWAADEKGDTENDWEITDTDDNLEDMEAMVAAMEMDDSKGKGERTKQRRASSKETRGMNSVSTPAFSCFEIYGLQEPATKKGQDIDDDDVGMVGGSDAKIQQMLARYMAEEDDEVILAAIRGAGDTGGGGPGGRGEKDERLSPDERALLTFTDRVKRAPRHIVRYARGGIPLLSIPLPKEPTKSGKRGHAEAKRPSTLEIPTCACGAERQFECQLMPALLHILDVDKHARSKQSASSSDASIDELMSREFNNGGMNWGTIAIYTCNDCCDMSREDFLVVQDSVDGRPEKREGPTDDAMVTDFGDDNDEELAEEDNNDDFDDKEDCDDHTD